jgi:cold shock CspA family protein
MQALDTLTNAQLGVEKQSAAFARSKRTMNRDFEESLPDGPDAAVPEAELPVPVMAEAPPARKTGAPLPLIAHMVARFVGSQEIPANEIPALVQTVSAALAQIFDPAPIKAPVEMPYASGPLIARRQRRARRASTGRKPGRPRKVAVPEPVAAPTPPPAPRLVRRAEAVASAPAPEFSALAPQPSSMLRGVVRWFDPARQSGGLRLTGIPEDVPVEPAVFTAAGVTRLFKGQEVEAQVSRADGRVRVTALRIPGGPAATPSASGPIAAMGGRRPRMVIVEKKRDGLKRVAARTEAEHLLGTPGEPKPPR